MPTRWITRYAEYEIMGRPGSRVRPCAGERVADGRQIILRPADPVHPLRTPPLQLELDVPLRIGIPEPEPPASTTKKPLASPASAVDAPHRPG
jgi:hypothetical protein